MIISSALGWAALPSILISVILAFLFGYSLTFWSLRHRQMTSRQKMKLAGASDTISITSMEIVDNLFILAVPGAIHAGLRTGLFWWSLLVSLLVAFIVTVPVNKWLIARGKGHAVVHEHHEHDHGHHHDM